MYSKVTILFPVFERYVFFEEAISSAITQTIKTPILVVDNGSSHFKFRDICSKYPDRVKYYRNESNIGMFPNWNKCVELAETEFVIIVGDDDILEENFIKRFKEVLELHSEIGVFYSNVKFLFHTSEKQTLQDGNWKNIWGLHTARDLKSKAFENQLEFPSISCIIRRDLLVQFPFIEEIHAANDKYFIYNLPDEVYFYGDTDMNYIYRRHEANDSSNSSVGPSLIVSHSILLYKCLPYVSNKYKRVIEFYVQLIYDYVLYRKTFLRFGKIESPYKSSIKSIFSINNFFLFLIAFIFLTIRTGIHIVRKVINTVSVKIL